MAIIGSPPVSTTWAAGMEFLIMPSTDLTDASRSSEMVESELPITLMSSSMLPVLLSSVIWAFPGRFHS